MNANAGGAPPKRRRRKKLPEEVETGHAATHYAGGEPERYTAHNAATQLDLTLACARLLGLDAAGVPPGSLILDAGCGSGLSTRALAAAPFRAAVVGFDVSPAMLAAAARPCTTPADPCVLADAGARWPVRPRAADGVVSVSVAQWLLVSPDPPAALTAFFTSLIMCLKPATGAIAQIYARTDAATDALAAAARRAGAAAALLVDVPHATPARKTFLAMVAPPSAHDHSPAFAAAAAGPPHDCPAAWPRARTACALWWRAAVAPQLVAAQAGEGLALPPDAHARLRDEHTRLALRLARVARRARGDRLPTASRRLEAWPPCPGANACGVPVLVSVLCEGGSGGVSAAALAAALGCETRAAEGAAPRPSTAAAAGKPPAITLAPTADPDVSTLSASVAAVAGFLVATVAEIEGGAVAAIAAATAAAASVAVAAGVGLYLVAADVDASGRVTAVAAWHAKNAGVGEEDARRVGAAVRETKKKKKRVRIKPQNDVKKWTTENHNTH